MSLIRKGLIGELKIEIKLLELEYNVYTNICDDGGVDLVIEKDHIYKKIQVKRATKEGIYGRLSFRLGISDKKPDFFICVYENKYWVIPEKEIKSKAFCIYHKKNVKSTKKYSDYLERWDILNN